MLPVIQAGAFDVATVKGEAQGTDQMQPGAGAQTGAADIACIPVDFGLDEDYVAFYGTLRKNRCQDIGTFYFVYPQLFSLPYAYCACFPS